jgi:hypothetical protein
MNTLRLSLLACAAAAGLGLATSGCVVTPARVRVRSEFVLAAPPAVIVETRGVAPRAGYVWIDGYWNWIGGQHVWVRGHWGAGRRGYVWVPHEWVQGERGWQLREGYWRRR